MKEIAMKKQFLNVILKNIYNTNDNEELHVLVELAYNLLSDF